MVRWVLAAVTGGHGGRREPVLSGEDGRLRAELEKLGVRVPPMDVPVDPRLMGGGGTRR